MRGRSIGRSPICSIQPSARAGRESDRRPGRMRTLRRCGGKIPQPSPQHEGERLKPPPDNSFDRRADFANAHRARASVARGFGEAPQQGYVGKTAVPPGELDPDLARALGIEEQDDAEVDARSVITPDMGPARLRLARSASGEVGTVAGLASQQSLDKLLREGRAEFREGDGATGSGRRTGRRGRKNPKAAARWSSNPTSTPRGISRRPSPNWSKASAATTARRFCSASPAPAKPLPWRR